MISAARRTNEDESLAALRDLLVLDSEPEAEFQALVEVASTVCGAPISLISLIDTDRQWFKANVGPPGVHETPRESALRREAAEHVRVNGLELEIIRTDGAARSVRSVVSTETINGVAARL